MTEIEQAAEQISMRIEDAFVDDENHNVVDALFAIAEALHRVAGALFQMTGGDQGINVTADVTMRKERS